MLHIDHRQDARIRQVARALFLTACEETALSSRALTARKALLRDAIANAPRIRYTDHIDEQGVTLFRLANELGLEGIVAKRADAPYPGSGRRSKDWVKIKTAHGRPVDEERAK